MDALLGAAAKAVPGADAVMSKIPGASPGATPATGLSGFLSKGFNAPWWLHIFITGIAPLLVLVPFVGPTIFTFPYTFGVNGINLLASNSMGWAAAKAALNFMCQTMSQLLSIYLPGWWSPYLKAILYYANPWFVFDILQVYNPKFKDEGYKIPFWNKQTDSVLEKKGKRKNVNIGFTDASGVVSYGLMGAIPIGAMAVLLLPAFYTMSANFPPELSAKMNPVLDMITSVGTAIAGIAGGGIGTFVLLPKLMSSLQTGTASIMSGGESIQTGGGIPSVNELAENMLKQSGGGTDPESGVFMGILAITVLGGLSLAVIRRKGLSDSTL
jgi:hypothetical protein